MANLRQAPILGRIGSKEDFKSKTKYIFPEDLWSAFGYVLGGKCGSQILLMGLLVGTSQEGNFRVSEKWVESRIGLSQKCYNSARQALVKREWLILESGRILINYPKIYSDFEGTKSISALKAPNDFPEDDKLAPNELVASKIGTKSISVLNGQDDKILQEEETQGTNSFSIRHQMNFRKAPNELVPKAPNELLHNNIITNKITDKLQYKKAILKFLSQHEEWAQLNNYLVENHYDDLLERFYWSADDARASQYEDGYKTPMEYGWTIEQVNQLLGQ